MTRDPSARSGDSAGLGAPPASFERVFGDRADVAEHYAALLATTGVEHGLIGPREVPRLWERHLLNCAVVASVPPAEARIADVGSGAGLPGLVWAIARPDFRIHLVEPLLRRTRWLTSAVEELGLDNVSIDRGKAAAFAGELVVDVVTARAVARLDELARWCLPLLGSSGEMLALKGLAATDELDEARPLLAELGVVDASVEEFGAGVVDPVTRVVRLRVGPEGPSAAGAEQSPVRAKHAKRARGRRSR